MPKSDTWPGGVAMESLSNMDSAGSCDSVISMNSACSEDSMEHLSAEERECLMYLEETIEALEVQEDSGLSNDETDSGILGEKLGSQKVNDISSVQSEWGRAHVSTPISEPQVSNGKDGTLTSLDLLSKSKPVASDKSPAGKIPPTQTKVLYVSMDTDGKPTIVTSPRISPSTPIVTSEVDLGLIPPPSDFMDQPRPAVQVEKVKYNRPSAGISSKKPGPTIDLEQLRQRASLKRTPTSSSDTQESPNEPQPEESLSPSQPTMISCPLMDPSPETVEPKSPPIVAPKPKKLPANIILKSNKVSAGSDVSAGHSVPANSDRAMMDHQRIRMEALRKLGLLKSDESDSGPAMSPKDSRRSWPAPPSPVSPAAQHTPPLTPSSIYVNSQPPAPVTSQSPSASSSSAPMAPAVHYSPEILPAPADFSDPVESLPSENKLSAVKDVAEELVNTPPLTPPALAKQLTPAKISGVKSATLERSGLGLSSYMADQDFNETSWGVSGKESPSQLRNSRPRPASLGSRKEFSSDHKEGLQAGLATSKESLPAKTSPAHAGNSQKLRSQGISVLICPRAENEDDRRKALKKLGLLRD
ncbi:hypothetical protein Q5P01_007950 [Channa striata]|uniref:Specifically androgen-regulated gene protein n=1 Tax=Channa striata TaxID=64152 RepID=A0AA88N989_CHASR|nr:hypothetical protein Q5P01_007950 [Channa striata]